MMPQDVGRSADTAASVQKLPCMQPLPPACFATEGSSTTFRREAFSKTNLSDLDGWHLQDEERGRSVEGGRMGSVWSATWGPGRLSRAASHRSVRSAHASRAAMPHRGVMKLRRCGLQTALCNAVALRGNALHWIFNPNVGPGVPPWATSCHSACCLVVHLICSAAGSAPLLAAALHLYMVCSITHRPCRCSVQVAGRHGPLTDCCATAVHPQVMGASPKHSKQQCSMWHLRMPASLSSIQIGSLGPWNTKAFAESL